MKLRLTHAPTDDEIEATKDGLRAYNRHFIPAKLPCPVAVFAEDENGEQKAGIIAETMGNWLMIKYLWVDESLRGQYIGSSLMQRAEEEAMARGCRYSMVDTFSFQARPFYERQGYECQMVLEDFLNDIRYSPNGEASHSRIYLTKTLR
ncbi:biphenyl 2,3-dioxygenase [Rahnella sp. AA]|uniref:GNAT family N-acetyltransferase n=1 Tax=Rahnella sp. AA TaxID=2057180 RepID=UPI000C33916A|nr:GNAT family N-acetyltransferase [Rahnella sp. AA]PKE29975.1 biphenyl 2,3-dioxygenase [Rahnella sp. AA]